MEINKIHEDLYIIPDFLSQEELRLVKELIDQATEEDWNLTEGFWKNKFLMKKDTFILPFIHKKISKLFNKYEKINPIQHIQRFNEGDFMSLHTDYSDDRDIAFGVVVYLNDDFEGGQIYYPDLGLEVTPKAGYALIHNGNYLHGVKVITKGVRYMLTTFVHNNKKIKAKMIWE